MILILVVGAFLRLRGIYWGEYSFMHPDERFLIWVGTDISPVNNLGEYFDTVNSSLNPNNRGHTFYVYGTLPMFLARYATEWVYGHSGFMEMTNVGRPLSAAADLLLVFIVYLIGARLYDRRVGLLGAAFSAMAVLQIQQSHFFTMDTFATLFTTLAFYYAARISMENGYIELPGSAAVEPDAIEGDGEVKRIQSGFNRISAQPVFLVKPGFWGFTGFGRRIQVKCGLNCIAPARSSTRAVDAPAGRRAKPLAVEFTGLHAGWRIGQPGDFPHLPTVCLSWPRDPWTEAQSTVGGKHSRTAGARLRGCGFSSRLTMGAAVDLFLRKEPGAVWIGPAPRDAGVERFPLGSCGGFCVEIGSATT